MRCYKDYKETKNRRISFELYGILLHARSVV